MEYDGRKQTHNDPDVAETTIAASNNLYVVKDEQARYVDDLLSDFVYTFNISAKFADGTFGRVTSLRVETSPRKYITLFASLHCSANVCSNLV